MEFVILEYIIVRTTKMGLCCLFQCFLDPYSQGAFFFYIVFSFATFDPDPFTSFSTSLSHFILGLPFLLRSAISQFISYITGSSSFALHTCPSHFILCCCIFPSLTFFIFLLVFIVFFSVSILIFCYFYRFQYSS